LWQLIVKVDYGDPAKPLNVSATLVLFTKDEYAVNAALCVDIRNIITHNRSVINRFFVKRNPRFADELGKRVVVAKEGVCPQFDQRPSNSPPTPSHNREGR